jgi:excinuclease UvrABC nuclease subunit
MTDLARVTRALPSAPGVYRFRDREGAVPYVGRAANLRDRVASVAVVYAP